MAEHQSGRISAYFSASKPLLPRKRPSDSSPFNPHRIKSVGDVSVAKRVPLAELPPNMPNAIGDYRGPFSDAVQSSFASAMTVSVPAALGSADENLCRSLFETPRRESEGSKLKQLDCFSTNGLLDDDFDESALEEIDSLVEKKSAEKVVEQQLDLDDSALEEIDILVEQKSAEKAAEQQLDLSCEEKVLSVSNIVGDVNLNSGFGTVSEGIGNGNMFSFGVIDDC